MKKYLFLLIVTGILSSLPVLAKDSIIPYQLTEKDSGGYHFVNMASEKMFENLIPRVKIDTKRIYDTYNKNLVPEHYNKYQDPNYNYVKYRYAELMYNKNTKDLVEIRVEKLTNPKSYSVYDYPTGRLKYIQIYDGASGEFVKFLPYGSLYNQKAYMSNLSLILTRRLNKNITTKPEKPVKIYIKINKNGELLTCKIQDSSDYLEIDDEIIKIITETAPFDKFPSYFPENIEMILDYRPIQNTK